MRRRWSSVIKDKQFLKKLTELVSDIRLEISSSFKASLWNWRNSIYKFNFFACTRTLSEPLCRLATRVVPAGLLLRSSWIPAALSAVT